MADNLTTTTTVSTPASGTVYGTDDCAGVHFQKIKLADGTADSTGMVSALTTLPASNAVGLTVRPLAMTDGTNSMPTGDAAGRKIYVGLANPLDYQDSICQVYDTVFNGAGTSYTIKSAIGNPASSGNNEVVALVAAKKIRVLGFSVQTKTSSSAVLTMFFRTSTAGAAISPTWDFDSREGISLYPQKGYLFETVAGEALGLNLSTANEVSVTVSYIEV